MKIVGPAAVIAFVLIVANSCDTAQTRRTSSASTAKPAAVKQAPAQNQDAARKRADQRKAAAERKAAADRKAAAERRKAQAKKAADTERQAEEAAKKRQAEEAAKNKTTDKAQGAPENKPAAEPDSPAQQPAPAEVRPDTNRGVAAARKLPVGQCPGKLSFGQQGGDVYMLQAALVARGFPTETDGRFGSETRQSVKNIQERRSLPATGKVDDAVWQALGRC